MEKTWHRLLKLSKLRLEEHQRNLAAIRNEMQGLHMLNRRINQYMEREIGLYDQILETHPIVPYFMRNITMRQGQIRQRLANLEHSQAEIQEALHVEYVETKQVEHLLHQTQKKAKAAAQREEQNVLDELAGRLKGKEND